MKRHIRREPGLGWGLIKTDVESVETGGWLHFGGEIQKPDTIKD